MKRTTTKTVRRARYESGVKNATLLAVAGALIISAGAPAWVGTLALAMTAAILAHGILS